MNRTTLVTALATLALASACSTEVTFGTGTGGSGASGGSGGNGAGTTTGTGSGGGDVCAGFDDEQSVRTMDIRIYNGTMQPIYLPADCGSLRVDIYALAMTDQEELRYTRRGDPCVSTCADLQDGSPIACGACQETVRLLMPGETYTDQWDGQGYLRREMPDACWWDGQGGECSQRVNANQEAFELSVGAGTECVGFGGPNGDECDCNEDGLCYGSTEGETFFAAGVATLGVDTGVDITFF